MTITTKGKLLNNGKYQHNCECGLVATVTAATLKHNCKLNDSCTHRREQLDITFPPTQGLGDIVANSLKKVGITQEAYSNAKKAIGLGGNCNCNWRQDLFNKLGTMVGLTKGDGQGAELQKIITLDNIKEQTVYQCDLHQQCLKTLVVSPDYLDIVQDAGYQLCRNCVDREQP